MAWRIAVKVDANGVTSGKLTGTYADLAAVAPGSLRLGGLFGPLVAVDADGRWWSVPLAIWSGKTGAGFIADTAGAFHPVDDADTPTVVGGLT